MRFGCMSKSHAIVLLCNFRVVLYLKKCDAEYFLYGPDGTQISGESSESFYVLYVCPVDVQCSQVGLTSIKKLTKLEGLTKMKMTKSHAE